MIRKILFLGYMYFLVKEKIEISIVLGSSLEV